MKCTSNKDQAKAKASIASSAATTINHIMKWKLLKIKIRAWWLAPYQVLVAPIYLNMTEAIPTTESIQVMKWEKIKVLLVSITIFHIISKIIITILMDMMAHILLRYHQKIFRSVVLMMMMIEILIVIITMKVVKHELVTIEIMQIIRVIVNFQLILIKFKLMNSREVACHSRSIRQCRVVGLVLRVWVAIHFRNSRVKMRNSSKLC